MMTTTIFVDQLQTLPVSSSMAKSWSIRYAFERSADSIKAGAPGQDYLVIHQSDERLAFVLCDGVSQSFYGDLAARILGDALSGWLWNQDISGLVELEDITAILHVFLQNLSEQAAQQVMEFVLPDDLIPMLRKVLEKKRLLGSETTFTAGCLDLQSGTWVFAWMGDSRLRAWGKQGETTDELFGKDTFKTSERWSTRRGVVGGLHVRCVSADELFSIVTYSDGLARLDRKLIPSITSNASLQQIIDENIHLPGSDDISYLEILLHQKHSWKQTSPNTPGSIKTKLDPKAGEISAHWNSLSDSSTFELALITPTGWRTFEVSEPKWKCSISSLPNQAHGLIVRSWQNGNVSPWSSPIPITLPQVQQKPEVELRSEPFLPKAAETPLISTSPPFQTQVDATRQNKKKHLPLRLGLLTAIFIMLNVAIWINTDWSKMDAVLSRTAETTTEAVDMLPQETAAAPSPAEDEMSLVEKGKQTIKKVLAWFRSFWNADDNPRIDPDLPDHEGDHSIEQESTPQPEQSSHNIFPIECQAV